MPQLLNPTAALIAGAIAVPLLLLLYFLKLRRSPAPIPTTLLWKRSVQDLQVNAPFQRLRRNLLLLLQLLAIGLLLFALARPISEGEQTAGARSILLIDRSASMQAADGEDGATRLEEAKQRAIDLVGTMGRGDQAMVVAFSDNDGTAPVQPFTQDQRLLRDAIAGIAAADRRTEPAAAYELANASSSFMDERLREDALQAADVYLYSDGRVPPGTAEQLSIRGVLHYEHVGSAAAGNVGIVAASVRRNYETPNRAQAFARVANFGPEPIEAAVRVSVADAGPDREQLDFAPVTAGPIRVTLPPARWTDDAFRTALREAEMAAADPNADAELPEGTPTLAEIDRRLAEITRRDVVNADLNLTDAAVVRFELLETDGRTPLDDLLDADDIAHVTVPAPDPVRVLVVLRDNFWLRLLIESQRLDDPRFVSPAEYEELLAAGEAAEFDVSIFDNYSPPSLPEAGTFVFIGGLPPAEATNVRQTTGDAEVPLFYEGASVLDWEREHPMLQNLNLNRLWVAEGRLVTVPLGAELLIEGVDGPMLLLERLARRTNLVFTFDVAQSTWPTMQNFPVFGFQMLQYLAALGDVRARESIQPGGVVSVPPAAVARAALEPGTGVEVRPILGEGEPRTYTVDDGGRLTLGPFDRVGLYETRPPIEGFRHVAVSLLDATESDLRPSATDPGNLANQRVDPVVAAGVAEDDGDDRTARIEWWWWLVAACVGMLMLEWVVYVRRVAV